MLKGLLRGEAAPRPLLMPLTFSLGARLENQPLRSFQSNPTRIANAQRQIRATLKLDSVTCYCDPLLEVEALGCQIEWKSDGSAALTPPANVEVLLQTLDSPEAILARGRIPVAVDVLQRLKLMLTDDPVLLTTVSGPVSMAAQVCGPDPQLLAENLEFFSGITASLARKFVESGADSVVVIENQLPLSHETFQHWAALLEPIINAVRFYDAVPVLLLAQSHISIEQVSWILERVWDCALCPRVELAALASAEAWRAVCAFVGTALEDVSISANNQTSALALLQALAPSFLTTTHDLSPGADLKQLTTGLDQLRLATLSPA